MAWSPQAGLGAAALARGSLIAAALLASVVLRAQDSKSYILAARRSGAIEIIDPTNLATVGRIHFDLPAKSSGLNGVSASADGTTLYVEGPIPNELKFEAAAGGCCVLYSIDLGTLQTKQVAGIGGTASRAAFVTSDGISYQAHDGPYLPPYRRWIFEVRRFRGPAIDVYDRLEGRIMRQLVPTGLDGQWWPTGTWMNDRFLFYAAKEDDSAARLWSVSPDATDLGAGVPVEPFGKVPGCSSYVEAGLIGAADNLFLYEMFGWKLDRREGCQNVPGGAWLLDPSSGRLLAHVAPDLYFSELVADRAKDELYGLSVGDPNWGGGIELVRMDARNGSILQSRVLESDNWRIAFAPLRTVPAADVRAVISAKK